MHDDEITRNNADRGGARHGIDRRQFLKAGAVLGGGILGGGLFGIADAMAAEREDATGAIRVLGCLSDTSTGGLFDISLPPVLRIQSGDIVGIETGMRSTGGMVPGSRTEDWNGIYREEMAKCPDAYFSPDRLHLTGPIHVDGAEPGDIMQMEILFTKARGDWHWADLKNDEFDRYAEIPFGTPARNLDGRESIAGTVLCVPIRVKGAGVVAGDIHFAHGEVDGSASKGAFRNIALRMTVRKDLKTEADRPFLPTRNHWIALGVPTDLQRARKTAVRKSMRLLNAHRGMRDGEGYAFCSMGADRHVTQWVERHAVLTHIRG